MICAAHCPKRSRDREGVGPIVPHSPAAAHENNAGVTSYSNPAEPAAGLTADG